MERGYFVEVKIRDLGEPGRLEERKDDPKSVLTSYISMEGKESFNCLINLLKGALDPDPDVADGKAAAKYIENSIKEDMKKEEKTTKGPELITTVTKTGHNGRPSISINVYRMG